MALILFVDGTDLLSYVMAGTLEVQRTADGTSGVMSFTLIGNPGDFTVIEESEVFLVNTVPSPGISEFLYGGFIRTISRESLARPGKVIVTCNSQDFSTLPSDDIVHSGGLRTTVETDRQRIAWLFSTFGTKGVVIGDDVQTLLSGYPPMDFTGKSLADGLNQILSFSSGKWYVDEQKRLHTYLVESFVAPHGLSDEPDGVTTFGYRDMSLPTDTTELRNGVWMIPAFGGDAVPSYYEDSTSVATWGHGRGPRVATEINQNIIKQTTLDAAGAAFLADHAHPKQTGSLTTYQAGLRPSQMVAITNSDHGLLAETFRITSVSTTFPVLEHAEYEVEFGDTPPTIRSFTDLATGGAGGGGGGGGGAGGAVGGAQTSAGQGKIRIQGSVGGIWAVWASNVSTEPSMGGAPATISGGHFIADPPGWAGWPGFGIIVQHTKVTTVTGTVLVPGKDVWLALPIGQAFQNPDGSWIPPWGQVADGIITDPTCAMFDTFRRSESGTLGNTSDDGRPWTTDDDLTANVSYGASGTGAFVSATADDGTFVASVAGTTGDPWINPGVFGFYVRFQASELGGVFRVQVVGGTSPDFSPAVVFTAFMDNTSGLYGVQDTTQLQSIAVPKIDWVPGVEYILQGVIDEYVGAGVRVWRNGEAIPPYFQYTYDGGMHAGMTTGATLGLAVSSLPNGVTMNWSDLVVCNPPALPVCDPFVFDDFNRVVATGLGTSSSGVAWDTDAASNSVIPSVDGAAMNWTFSTGHNIMRGRLDWGPTFSTVPPWDGNNFTMTSRFKTSVLLASGHTGHLLLEIDKMPDFDVWRGVEIAPYNSGTGGHVSVTDETGTVATVTKTDWVADTWYSLKWQFVKDGPNRVKVWPSSGSEPSTWLVEATDTGSADFTGADTEFFMEGIQSGTIVAQTMSVDSIGFEYAGMSCIPSSLCGPFETFDRTVTSGWGTSPAGVSWTTHTLDKGYPADGAPTYGVGANGGFLTGGTSVTFFSMAYMEQWAGHIPALDGDFLMTARVHISAVAANISPHIVLMLFDGAENNIPPVNYCGLTFQGTTGTKIQVGQTTTFDQDTVSGTPTAGYYNLRWQRVGTTLNAVYWKDSDPVPADDEWAVSYTASQFGSANLAVGMHAGIGRTTSLVSLDINGISFCPPTTWFLDDFQRTVADADPEDTWGTATPTPDGGFASGEGVWADTEYFYTHLLHHSVDGTMGIMAATPTMDIDHPSTSSGYRIHVPYDNGEVIQLPWSGDWPGGASGPPTPAVLTVRWRRTPLTASGYEPDVPTLGGDRNDNAMWFTYSAWPSSSLYRRWTLSIKISFDGTTWDMRANWDTNWYGSSTSTSDPVTLLDAAADIWMISKVRMSATETKFKTYAESSVEPDWQIEVPLDWAWLGAPGAKFQVNNRYSVYKAASAPTVTGTGTLHIDYVRIDPA